MLPSYRPMTQGKSFGKTIVHVGSGTAKTPVPAAPPEVQVPAAAKAQPEAPLMVRRRVSLNAPAKEEGAEQGPKTKPQTTGDFGATLVGASAALTKAPVERRMLYQSSPANAGVRTSSSPPTQQSNQARENPHALFSSTVQGGTAPVFLQSTAPKIHRDSSPDLDDDRPIPSVRLAQSVKQELSQLNTAINSTRAPGVTQGSRPTQAPEPDPPLPRVGRYEVLARLKRGGMGSVYLCRFSGAAGFQRLFAMKVLRSLPSNGADTGAEQFDALGAFFREAELLSQLHHPNIVGVVDVGTPTEPYLVLDYVEGGSLFELCDRSPKQRDPSKIVTIILDALAGLDAAHRAVDKAGRPLNLVHCDLTPHNLLVSVDGSCRIADFGIARARGGAESQGPVWGKPGYLAPELILGHPVDQRADIFSMGVVLYYSLTGVEPFRGASAEETLRNVVEQQVPPPSQVGFCPPPALDWVCMTALEKAPSARFQTAEEMLTQVRRVVARQEFFSTPAQVAAWVEETMGPKLEEQRAAIRRAADSSRPPEAPVPTSAHPRLDSSRLEQFDRVSRAPSSYAPREATLILSEDEQRAAAAAANLRPEPPRASAGQAPSSVKPQRMSQWINQAKANKPLILAVGAMLVITLAALLFPRQFSRIFRTESAQGPDAPPAVEINVKSASPDHAADRPAAQPTLLPTSGDESGPVKLPPIKTASDND